MFEDKTYENGQAFQQAEIEQYFIDYIAQDSDILFVTFEGLFPKMGVEPWQRMPWGAKFLIEQGYGVLGVKTKHSCWYRDAALHDALESDQVRDIFDRYSRVIFYGESMGGYAALAFSSLVEGAEVLAYAPQTTLDEKIVPWDDRYTKYGRKANWTGRYKDAAAELDTSKRVCIVYDPFDKYDPQHIARLPQDKITKLKAPFMDHELAAYISGFKLMKPAVQHFVDGTIEEWWPSAIRIRKTSNIYLSNLHYGLALRAIKHGRSDDAIPQLEEALKANIKNKKAVELARALVAEKSIKTA